MKTLTEKHTILYHDTYGDKANPACVLLPGLGAQSISWSDSFCSKLADLGLYVLRMDNRDCGRSKIFTEYPVPDLQEMLKGGYVSIHYNLEDMANDVIMTLSHMGIDKAHVMGRSMGGMIAQIFASLYPKNTLSLCVIMSTTGNSVLTQPDPEVMSLLMKPKPNPESNRNSFVEQTMKFFKLLSGDPQNFDDDFYQSYILSSLDRGYSPSGTLRQISAMIASGDIRRYLSSITAPTLVIHGLKDPMFGIDAAKDVNENIKGAHLCLIDEMGHEIPPGIDSQIIDAIKSYLISLS